MLEGAATAGAIGGLAGVAGTEAAPAGAAKAVSQRATTATTANAERARARVEVWNATIPCPIHASLGPDASLGPPRSRRASPVVGWR